MKGGNWKTISSERHFANRNLEVVTDRVQTSSRSDARTWTIVHRKPAVVIAPMTRDGKIILIRQERIPIGQAIWEMPSGQVDDPDAREDKIKDTALREVREETGYELAANGELISLGIFFFLRGLPMNALISFWPARFSLAQKARIARKANRFSIAADSRPKRFVA